MGVFCIRGDKHCDSIDNLLVDKYFALTVYCFLSAVYLLFTSKRMSFLAIGMVNSLFLSKKGLLSKYVWDIKSTLHLCLADCRKTRVINI